MPCRPKDYKEDPKLRLKNQEDFRNYSARKHRKASEKMTLTADADSKDFPHRGVIIRFPYALNADDAGLVGVGEKVVPQDDTASASASASFIRVSPSLRVSIPEIRSFTLIFAVSFYCPGPVLRLSLTKLPLIRYNQKT